VLKPDALAEFNLIYPCIVKPCTEDASHGISDLSVVEDLAGLTRQVNMIKQCVRRPGTGGRFVGGREFNSTVMGNTEYTALPPSEIVYTLPEGMPKLLTFAAKWEIGSVYYLNTQLTVRQKSARQKNARFTMTITRVYQLFGCKGYARVDMRLDKEGKVNVIEVNPNPDISPGTGAARQADAAGMTYARFMDKI